MAISFSILWWVSTGPFFTYLLYFFYWSILQLFSPQNDDIFYVIKNSTFFIDRNISETWTRIKLKQLSKILVGSFSEKKKCIVLKGKKLFFPVKQPCHRTSLNFILSMFSRKIYSKFYVVFTTYKNSKIKKTMLERYSVKKYF